MKTHTIKISDDDRAMYERALRYYHKALERANNFGTCYLLGEDELTTNDDERTTLPDDPEEVKTHIDMLDMIEGADDIIHDFTA